MAQSSRARDSSAYARAIAALVTDMAVEQAAEVYDFARFLQAKAETPEARATDLDDWLYDSEEELQAEDAQWETAYQLRRGEITALADAARAEILAGATESMFNEHDEFVIE